MIPPPVPYPDGDADPETADRACVPAELAETIAFLRQPDAYPWCPVEVEVIETHMTWVFLTGDRAYKLKKPVRDAFRDFSTVAARHASCKSEVHLNSRLAPGVYLGIVPLVRAAKGMQLGGVGEVVDWLVEMRRLPRASMLDEQIRRHVVQEPAVRALGRVLGQFYRDARRHVMTGLQYRRRLLRDIRATRRALLAPRYHLSGALVTRIAGLLTSVPGAHAALFDERARDRRIVDGHGDLRPEHICLEPEPLIIDCIEYNADLRALDAVSDMAFLFLECQRLGAEHVGRLLMETFARCSGDRVSPVLLHFYAGQHAYTRAKIAAWHLDDPGVADHARFFARAEQYLSLAEQHALDARRGLPGERAGRRSRQSGDR